MVEKIFSRRRNWKVVAQGIKGVDYCWGFRCFNEDVAMKLISSGGQKFVVCGSCAPGYAKIILKETSQRGSALYGYRIQLEGGE